MADHQRKQPGPGHHVEPVAPETAIGSSLLAARPAPNDRSDRRRAGPPARSAPADQHFRHDEGIGAEAIDVEFKAAIERFAAPPCHLDQEGIRVTPSEFVEARC